MFMIFGKNNFI